MKRIALLVALLLPSLAFAQSFRVGSGIQCVPRASAPTKVGTNGAFYCGSDGNPKYINQSGVITSLGSGGGSTGNWAFSGNTADLSGAGIITIGGATATGIDLAANTGQSIRLRVNGTNVIAVSGSAVTLSQPLVLTGTQTGTYTLGGAPSVSSDMTPTSDNALLFGDNTHRWLRFYGSSIGPATAQMHVVPAVASDTIALLAASQTFTTKTYSSPIFSGSSTGTWNLGGTVTATSPILSNVGSAIVAPTWTGVTYLNSWVDYGASTTTRYTKGPDGKITLEIRAKNGSSGTAQMFAMPANFRPGQNLQLVGYNASGATCLGDLIASTGAFNASFGAATSGMFFRIEYYAEQ